MSTNKIFIMCVAFSIVLSACSNDLFLTHNGNMPSNERISQLKIGDTKEQVVRTIGAPYSVVSFDKNT